MADSYWIGGGSPDNNAYDQANNHSTGSEPGAGDNVEVGPRDTMYAIDGVDKSAVAIGNFYVLPGFTKAIGDFATVTSAVSYLQIDPNDFRFAGTGVSYIDISSANISPLITNTATATTGKHGLYLKGSNMANPVVQKGNVGFAALPLETATISHLRVGYINNRDSDAKVFVSDGVTLSNYTQEGGENEVQCACSGTVRVHGGTLVISGAGAIGTLQMDGPGTVYLETTGTTTTINLNHPDAVVEMRRSNSARTVTNLNFTNGGTFSADGNIVTVTNFNEPSGRYTAKVTI